MHVLVLAGGFAKRMWPLTEDRPKSLLTVGGKPIIEYITSKLEEIEEIDMIYIVTNNKFYINFLSVACQYLAE